MPLLPRLLKTFYRTGLPCLPVVGTSSTSELELLGFASRQRLDHLMADLDRARGDFAQIPDAILIRDHVPPEALFTPRSVAEIPVLDIAGEQVANWDEARLLKAVATFREGLAPRAGELREADAAGPPGAPGAGGRASRTTFLAAGESEAESTTTGRGNRDGHSGQRWLGEMILGALPYGLFATDLQGNTLFYNGRFEERILTKRALGNSIRRAETFFLELTRTLLAQSFEEDPQRKHSRALTTFQPDLQVRVRVLNLEQDGRIQGYLYLFQDPGEGELFSELADRVARGQGLEQVVDEVEGQFIYLMLERHGQNVSHTAKALKIKRSTLQNKIKRLQIDERYQRRIEGPIRRHRRTVEQILAERERPAKAAAPAVEDRVRTVSRPSAGRSSKNRTGNSGKVAPKKKTKSAAQKPGTKKAARQIEKKTARLAAPKNSKRTVKKTAKKTVKKTARAPKKAAPKKSG